MGYRHRSVNSKGACGNGHKYCADENLALDRLKGVVPNVVSSVIIVQSRSVSQNDCEARLVGTKTGDR